MTSASPADVSQPAPRRTWLERGFLLAAILGGAAAMSPNQADPDLWGHVTYGIDALRDGLAPTATYSYTAEGYRWINHENLAEIVMALVAVAGGAIGLLVLKFALSLVILGSMACWGIRQGRSLLALCVVLIVVAINLAYWWAVRPQMFSFTFMALVLLLLSYAFEGWEGRWHLPWPRSRSGTRQTSGQSDDGATAGTLASSATAADAWFNIRRLRWLWLAAPIFFLWTNTHGGFVAGVAIFCAILGLRCLEAICTRGWAATGIVKRFALMIAVACAVTLLNPYSYRLHEWLYVSLSVPRPEIGEWTSLKFGAETFWPFVVLASLIVISLAFSRKSLDFTQLVVLALVAWQALSHERHTAFLALLAGFWLPPYVEGLLERLRMTRKEKSLAAAASRRGSFAWAGGLCLVLALLGVRLYQRLSYMPVAKDKWPVAAMQYIADRQLEGKLLVTFNWAQYAIAALGPSTPQARDGMLVQFDGRYDTCYPFEIVDMHFDFILGDGGPGSRWRSPKSGPIDGSLALKHLQPDVLLLSRGQPHSQKMVREQKDQWALLYQDGIAQVWGRKSKFDNFDSPQFVPLADRVISSAKETGSVCWPALPQRRTASGLANAMGLHGHDS